MKTDCRQLIRRLVICISVTTLLPLDDVRSEEFPLSTAVPHCVPEPLRPKLQELAQQQADELYNHLLLRTDEADRVCGISGVSVAMLELAAKGAVQHGIDDWLAPIAMEYASDPAGPAAQILTMRIDGRAQNQMVRIFRGGGGIVINNGKVIAGGAQLEAKFIELRPANAKLPDGIVIADGIRGQVIVKPPAGGAKAVSLNLDLEAVSQSSVWRTTLDRILTKEQQSKLSLLRFRRESPAHESLLAQMLKCVDEELLLDDLQRDRITEMFAKFLLDRNSSLDATTLVNIALKTLSPQEVAELLSDRQNVRWQEMRKTSKGTFDAFRPNVIPEAPPRLNLVKPRAVGF